MLVTTTGNSRTEHRALNYTSNSAILNIHQTNKDKFHLTYDQITKFPIAYGTMQLGVKCNDRIICGGGFQSFYEKYGGDEYDDCDDIALKDMYEWSASQFMPIKPFNIRYYEMSSVYVPPDITNTDGVLIVISGYHGTLGTMQYLIMDDMFRSNDWNICSDRLPCHIPQINILGNKLILTGGGDADRWGEITNKVWEGSVSFEKELRVKWALLPPMRRHRVDHVSVVIDDEIFCIGGGCEPPKRTNSDGKTHDYTTEFFSFKSNVWQKGPDLPFPLERAKAVFNKLTKQCFIVEGSIFSDGNVYFFDPEKGLIDIVRENEDIFPNGHIAVLL